MVHREQNIREQQQHHIPKTALAQAHKRRPNRRLPPHLEAAVQGVAQVLCDLVHPDAPHGAHSQRADQRVGVLGVLLTGRQAGGDAGASGRQA